MQRIGTVSSHLRKNPNWRSGSMDSFSIGVCYSGLDLGRNRGIDLLPFHGYAWVPHDNTMRQDNIVSTPSYTMKIE